ncbi:hypothetical protein [Lutispora thermophila]|uniref:Uncharacterized protein n=1 Tax=Lutispora thermophila DSM 19022 TaxID=1122184 RepID=A0A1M6IQ35_9FIRM|nr:hypothetical protein [Lutispora thermophila]SHJ36537.1 hypothetical protein SAMN02745176_03355 [Lutispora thermophila DSM 19022]
MNISLDIIIIILLYLIISIPASIMAQKMKDGYMGLGHYIVAIFIIAPITTGIFLVIGKLCMFLIKWLTTV